jgi:ribonuclease VapC
VTIFVDASALIAIVALEADGRVLAGILASDTDACTSALAAWEAVTGLCRSKDVAADEAHRQVHLFLREAGIRFVAIAQPEFDVAAQAYARFGKGRHPAALNLGDCFAYACATTNRAKLLFKGDDFTQTDIEAA